MDGGLRRGGVLRRWEITGYLLNRWNKDVRTGIQGCCYLSPSCLVPSGKDVITVFSIVFTLVSIPCTHFQNSGHTEDTHLSAAVNIRAQQITLIFAENVFCFVFVCSNTKVAVQYLHWNVHVWRKTFRCSCPTGTAVYVSHRLSMRQSDPKMQLQQRY